jgi:polar amino acid transport system substrate-binding protein
MRARTGISLLVAAMLTLAACQGPGTGGTPSPSLAAPSASATEMAEGHLARILDAGVIRVSTDPEYPPQSFLNADTEEFEGFDIDVATEIATRLGVDIEFETPAWEAITAGSWSDRWDLSVGSMTITEDRKAVVDFTQPYYYTPAQMATFADSGITSLDDLGGKTVCVGAGTTYLDWLDGHLTLTPEAGEVTDPPEGAESTTFDTDIKCADAWRSGRFEFDGWLSSSTTVEGAIAAGYEIEKVGEPVFFEPLAVAFDSTVEDNDSLVAEIDRIVGEMHADGTLSELSVKWFCVDGSYPCEDPETNGLDLTVAQ